MSKIKIFVFAFVLLSVCTIFAAMIQIETIFDILWKGFIIGVIVSAPWVL